MACLSVKDLSKKYNDFPALAPVSFDLNAGEIVILSGPNGSGKTTLLSCLSGLVYPSQGEVKVAGFDLYSEEEEAHRRLMYVPDVPAFYMELTAWEHLKFIAQANRAMSGFEERAEDLLQRFGLWEARDLFPHHFSRGMRLKLGLVLALIRPFEVLILDEPTSALDQESMELLKNELLALRQKGIGVLLSTHDPALIAELGDRQMKIGKGQVEVV